MNARTTTPIPPETRARILAMRARGMSYAEIVDATGVSQTSVARFVKEDHDGAERVKPNGDILVVLNAEERGRLPGQEAFAVATAMISEREAKVTSSLKARVLKAVCESGPFPDANALVALLRQPGDNWSHHEVVSALHQLRKQGMVKFRTDKNPKAPSGKSARVGVLGGGNPLHIEATRAAGVNGVSRDVTSPMPEERTTLYREPDRTARPREIENRVTGTHPAGYSRAKHAVGRDYTEPRRHGPYANGGPVEIVRASAPETVAEPEPVAPKPEPSGDPFPLLTELQGRFRENAERDAKASKYAEAAAALEDIDPERSEQLMALALEAGGKPFSPVEIEYLRFVQVSRFFEDG